MFRVYRQLASPRTGSEDRFGERLDRSRVLERLSERRGAALALVVDSHGSGIEGWAFHHRAAVRSPDIVEGRASISPSWGDPG